MASKKNVRWPSQPWYWRLLHPRGKNTWRGYLTMKALYRKHPNYFNLSRERRLFVTNHWLYFWDYVFGPIWSKILTVLLILVAPWSLVQLGIYVGQAKWDEAIALACGMLYGAITVLVVKGMLDA